MSKLLSVYSRSRVGHLLGRQGSHQRRRPPCVIQAISRQQCRSLESFVEHRDPPTTGSVQRRSLLLGGAVLASSLTQLPIAALAEELGVSNGANTEPEKQMSKTEPNPQVYFDLTIDNKPAGRIVVELLDPESLATQRFKDLAQGKEGVGYRRSKINFVQDGYVQNGGVKSLSYSASGRVPIAGGEQMELLEDELALRRRSHDAAGVVSLVVRNRKERASRDKLTAVGGQLVTVTETFGELPNGTAFAITTQPQPELDDTHLPVGRVVSGGELVQQLLGLPRVKDNSGSPFFKAGKLSGDKRADVAERAFGRPFARIVVAECGVL